MRYLPHIVLAIAIVATVAGGVVLLSQDSSSGGVEIILPSPTSVSTANQEPQAIGVYITGAVQRPGVYAVKEGDRLAQVLQIAGGPTSKADLNAVNLAVRVRDEDHWHIPEIGEPSQNLPTPASTSAAQSAPTLTKVNINTADPALLETLPGIGEARARDIVSYRDTNGPFLTVEDLLSINGIGPATLDSIRELIEVQ